MFSFALFLIFFVLISILFFSNRKWWIKIQSQTPKCTYYFGPFNSFDEAESLHRGYLHDLEVEGAEGISFVIEQCYPRQLTITEEELY